MGRTESSSAALLPWRGEISAVAPPTTSDSAVTVGSDVGGLTQAYVFAGYAAGSYMTWDLVLAAGTYTFDFLMVKADSAGIMTFQIDGVDIGSTWDGYAAAPAANNFVTFASTAIASTGKHTLKIKCDTKNASSGYYRAMFQGLFWQRTA